MQTDDRESVSTPTIPPLSDEVVVLVDNQMNGMVKAFVICYVSAIYNSSEMLGYDFQILGITDHRQVIPTHFFFSLYPFTLGLWKLSQEGL